MSALNTSKLNVLIEELPELVMFVGIPASGKSTTTEYYEKLGYSILSSDSIRLSFLESEEKYPHDQKEVDKLNVRVFETIRNRAVAALKTGKSVVIDATNLSRKRRMAFLSNLGRTKCVKKCMLFITPMDVCFARNASREGLARVPVEAMYKMLKNFECPGYWEGWDKIEPVVSEDTYDFPFEATIDFSQDNPHHTLTLYEHLKAAQAYAVENGFNSSIQEVALYHDIGKLYVKEFKNRRGDSTDFAHFYDHENYGAYLYLTEMCSGRHFDEEYFRKILYNTNLINCHMKPLNSWEASPAAKQKDILIFGEDFIRDLELVNRADRAAH